MADEEDTGLVQRRPEVSRDLTAEDFWPRDPETGEPMVKIGFQVSELIGLPKYSNVTVGPGNIELFVRKGDPEPLDAGEKDALASALMSVANTLESVLIAHRGKVLGDLKQHYMRPRSESNVEAHAAISADN